jgi:ABC-type uncharacterized transport system involved in gliding motility auxiliary subunit
LKNQPVRFGSIILKKLKKPNRTEPKKKPEKNRAKIEKPSQNQAKTGKNRAKTEKTKPKQFKPVFILKNRTEPKPVGLNWFRFF